MTPMRPNDPPTVPPASTPPATAVAPGATDGREPERPSEDEPVVTGTLFLTVLMLGLIAGFWITMYLRLLHS